MNAKSTTLILFALMTLTAQIGHPQTPQVVNRQSNTSQAGKYALGLQNSTPAWGISAKYRYNERLTLQAIIDPIGDYKDYGMRAVFKYTQDKYWHVYGFAGLALWSYPSSSFDRRFNRYLPSTQSTLGLGGGVGIEYDWSALGPDLPPISWSLELGLNLVDESARASSTILGIGAHYYFERQ